LANIIEIFATEFSTYLYIVGIQRKDRILLHVFNYSFKTQVSVTTQTHARSQLSPMKQCDYSSIVVTFFLTKNVN